MLQFLQCKTFGNQQVPKGWIIVAAGDVYKRQDIPLKTINYKFGNYKIEVSVTDNAGIVRILKKTGTASVRVKTGTLTVTKLANGTEMCIRDRVD